MSLPKAIRQAIQEGGANEENTALFIRWASQYVTQCKKDHVPVVPRQVFVSTQDNERCLLFFSLIKKEEPLRIDGDKSRSISMACVTFCKGTSVPTPMELYAEIYTLCYFNFYTMLLADMQKAEHAHRYDYFWANVLEDGEKKGLSAEHICTAIERHCRNVCTVAAHLTPLYISAVKDYAQNMPDE